jgi:hypothetical protein
MEKTRNSRGVSKIVHYDVFQLRNFSKSKPGDALCAYFVMPKYKINLQTALKNYHPDAQSVFDIGSALIDSLKTVHSAGRTYNDIKPENVMIHDS